jgi:hypothetical protein
MMSKIGVLAEIQGSGNKKDQELDGESLLVKSKQYLPRRLYLA